MIPRFAFAVIISLIGQVAIAQDEETASPIIEPVIEVNEFSRGFVEAPPFWKDSPIDRLAKIARESDGDIEKIVEEYLAAPSYQDMEYEFWTELDTMETREAMCELLPTVTAYSYDQFNYFMSVLGVSRSADLFELSFKPVDSVTSIYLALVARETLKGHRIISAAQNLHDACLRSKRSISYGNGFYFKGGLGSEVLQFWIARDPTIGGNLFDLKDDQVFSEDGWADVYVSPELQNSYLQSSEFFLDSRISQDGEFLEEICQGDDMCLGAITDESEFVDPALRQISENPRMAALVRSIRPWQNNTEDGGPNPVPSTSLTYVDKRHFRNSRRSSFVEVFSSILDRFFPEVEEVIFYGSAIHLDWKSVPRNVHTIKIYNSPFVHIELPNWRGRHIRINESIIEDINLHRASLEQGFNTYRSYVETRQNKWRYVTEENESQYSFSSSPKMLDFRSIQGGYLSIEQLEALQVSPWDLSLEGKEDDERYELNMYGAQISGSVRLVQLEDAAKVDLEDVDAGTIIVQESIIPGTVRLYDTEANGLYIKSNGDIGFLDLQNSRLNQVFFGKAQGADAFNSIGRIRGGYNSAVKNFHINSTEVREDAYFGFMSTGNLFIDCARFHGSVDFEVLNTPTSVNFQSFTAKELDLYGVKLHNLAIGQKSRWCSDVPETKIDKLYIPNASIENAKIRGAISKLVDLSSSRFESVNVANLIVGEDAEVVLNTARINALSASQQTFDANSQRKRRVNLRGAEIETIYLVDYDKSDDLSAMDLPNGVEIGADNVYDAVAQSELFLETLPTEFGLTNDGQYVGNAYYTLRRSASAAGYPDVERELAIRQNLHLMQQLRGLGAKTLYTLGHWINDFGYNNQRAFFLLAALWGLGVAIANIDYLAWVAARLCKKEEAASLDRPNFRFVYPLFLSIDRTIPTLSLDSGFGSPHSSFDGIGSTARNSTIVAFFYVQRIAGFVIVLFVLGGVFDVFE